MDVESDKEIEVTAELPGLEEKDSPTKTLSPPSEGGSARYPRRYFSCAILAWRNRALEIAILIGMVFGQDREPTIAEVERRSFRHRPTLENAAQSEAEVIVKMGSPMLLHEEDRGATPRSVRSLGSRERLRSRLRRYGASSLITAYPLVTA
jgi:hypothetical protein